LLVSHGNTSTIGIIYPTLVDFAYQFKCDILTYDYTGYGHSNGVTTLDEIYSDIEEVGRFAKNILHVPTNELILFGCNIGSLPSLHLATQSEYNNIKGIILMSPVSTGVRIISTDIKIKQLERMKNYDIYHDIRGISNIRCNVLLIHGMKDDVIPVESSKELAKHILSLHEWTPKKGDNGNILTIYRTKFIIKCKSFFEYLNYRKSKSRHNEKYEDANEDYINSCIENGFMTLDHLSTTPVYNTLQYTDIYEYRKRIQNTHSMTGHSCPFDTKYDENAFNSFKDSSGENIRNSIVNGN
jgi:hypothetical protein